MVDLNRASGAALPAEVAAEIWAATIEASTVMQLARKITLPGSGVSINTITGDAEASWTGETANASVSRSTLGKTTITPYKLTVIEPFSNEFKRDLPGLYAELARRLPQALGTKFDRTVFGNVAPGSNFDVLGGAAAVGIAPHATNAKLGTYKGLVNADAAVSAAGGMLDGWVLSPQARSLLLAQVDSAGRPLIVNNIQLDGAVPALLGQSAYSTKGVYAAGNPNQLGFAGDFSSAVYGVVNGIQISASSEATLIDGTRTVSIDGGTGGTFETPNELHLFQAGMFALKVEIEIGFRAKDVANFVRLTDAIAS